MNGYKGRLTFAKGTYVEFVVDPNQEVDFGDILVVEGNNGERFYIRTYDFSVKSRWSGINNVGYLMSKLDNQGQVVNQEELDFYLGGNHTVKIAKAEQLCYSDAAGSLWNPKTCPDFFSEIRALTADDTALLSELKGDIEFGFLKSGRGVLDLPVGIYGTKAIPEHIGIFGTTGSGKSNLVKVLASSILGSAHYGLLIFDVHDEYYQDLVQHPMASQNLKVFSVKPNSEYESKLNIAYADVDPEDITACATFTEPQLDALYKLSSVWQEQWLPYMLRYEIPDIADELAGATGQKFQSRTLSKIKSICWNLQQELGLAEESCVAEILDSLRQGKVALIQMKNVSPVGEQALSTLLSKKLLSRCAGNQHSAEDKPVMIVIEEAHRFLGKKEYTSNNVFARLVSEARKFNLGLCVVDQQPRLLADKVLSQLNTLFILGLASKSDRTKLETMCRKDILQQRNEIKNLDCGEMIVATNYMRFAAPVRVHKLEDYLVTRYHATLPDVQSLTPVPGIIA
jgi:hypothetical protein